MSGVDLLRLFAEIVFCFCCRNMTLKPLMGCCMWWSAGLPRETSQLSWPTMMLGSTVSKQNFFVCVFMYKSKLYAHCSFNLGTSSASTQWPGVNFPISTTNKRCLCVIVCTFAFVHVQREALWKWCVWAAIRAVIWMPADYSLSVLLTDCMQREKKLISGGRWSKCHICDGAKTLNFLLKIKIRYTRQPQIWQHSLMFI